YATARESARRVSKASWQLALPCGHSKTRSLQILGTFWETRCSSRLDSGPPVDYLPPANYAQSASSPRKKGTGPLGSERDCLLVQRAATWPQGPTMKAMERFSPRAHWIAGALVGIAFCGTVVLAQAPQGKVVVDDVVIYGNRLVPTQRVTGMI